MKIIKKIKTANVVQKESMLYVLGAGARTNNNSASRCTCHGSDGHFWCGDNTNTANGCSCSGNSNNTNSVEHCRCS